jgi:hypothetical protein
MRGAAAHMSLTAAQQLLFALLNAVNALYGGCRRICQVLWHSAAATAVAVSLLLRRRRTAQTLSCMPTPR